MEKLQTIDYAITQTLIAHPDFTNSINFIIYSNIVNPNGIRLENFTNKNGARGMMKNITQQDLLEFILNETIKSYNAITYFYYNNDEMKRRSIAQEKLNYLLATFPSYAVIQKAIYKIANPKINSIIYYLDNTKELLALVDAVAQNKYQTSPVIREYIDRFGNGSTYVSGYGEKDLFNKINEDFRKTSVARNIQVNHRAVNKCLTEVMNGNQLKNQRNEYGLDGTLYATQDIGKRRKNQEDSVLIINHPENPDFKLLVVSDGMGGVDYGEKASQYTVQELAKWFNSISKDYFYYPLDLQKLFNQKITSISQEIYETYNKDFSGIQSGATLAGAIVTKEQTIVSCVGDSRVYTVSDGRLRLLSRDESYVWPPGRRASEITNEELDDLRFEKENNKISFCIGEELRNHRIQSLIVPNSGYDRLLLFSDGVTDLLSQEKIRIISSQARKELVTKMLVDEALKANAVRLQGADEYHNAQVPAGKDNASAVMYARR